MILLAIISLRAIIYFLLFIKPIYLGHPNARLFISHGGLIGLQEAIYHAVPILGIPLRNFRKLSQSSKRRLVLKLDWDEITENVMHGAIHKLLNEPRLIIFGNKIMLKNTEHLCPIL